MPEAVLLKDTARSRVSQHVVSIESIEAETFEPVSHYGLDNFAHVTSSPNSNRQPETQLSLQMLAIDITHLNQAVEPSFRNVLYCKCGGLSIFAFSQLPCNIPLGFAGRIGMWKGDHGISDLTGTGCLLNC